MNFLRQVCQKLEHYRQTHSDTDICELATERTALSVTLHSRLVKWKSAAR